MTDIETVRQLIELQKLLVISFGFIFLLILGCAIGIAGILKGIEDKIK